MLKNRITKGRLARKLILAFILVAVPPMLIAGKVATELVNNAINNNVGHWLKNTTHYLLASLEESESELEAVHTLLYERFGRKDVAFNPEELKALSNLDADILVLRDASGATLLASPPVREIASTPLFPKANLKWVIMEDGLRELAIVVSGDVQAHDGTLRRLELANLFSIDLSETGKDEPVSMRVFVPTADGFVQAYSSTPEALPDIPRKALESVLAGAEVYIPDRDWTDDTPNAHLFLKGFSGSQGETIAILAVSAHMLPYDGWLPSSRQLFCFLFLAGMLLASSVGYFFANRIVRPIRLLNEGVKNIASGNLEHRIAEGGTDEIAELSAGFNLMGRQLGAMYRESMASARRERSRMLGEVALGFAHEIRNPLVVIRTSAELVHAKLPKDGKDLRLMGFVVEEVGRIDSLIKEFLAFATPMPVNFEPVPLHSLAREVLEICAAEFEKRTIRHSLVIDAPECNALAEQNQIRQVLLNLLLNAMDAMPEGGDLTVRLYESTNKKNLCLEVTDTGVGIPEDVLPTIYQPFSSTKKGGLGLGLAKTQAIVEAHGGSITCTSSPGRGTVFTVCLNR